MPDPRHTTAIKPPHLEAFFRYSSLPFHPMYQLAIDSGDQTLLPTKTESSAVPAPAVAFSDKFQPTGKIVLAIAHAYAVFGDEEKTVNWLESPLSLYDNRKPSELLLTEEGLEQVETTLTRIEHNIPS